MTAFDYAFLAIVGISAAVGLWRGLVSEILALAAWALAILAAWLYVDTADEILTGYIADPFWRTAVAYASVVVVVLLLVAVLRYLLRQLLRAAGLGATDRMFGVLFGLLRGLAIALVLVVLGGLVPDISRQPWWADAVFAPTLEAAAIGAKPWLPDVVADRISFSR
ncbi:MAG: CvpA family protein [Azoarcus sp.]|jgi:membrane protein required for colicin V production|nr:CvpA family protein [Azoarcus sp.]